MKLRFSIITTLVVGTSLAQACPQAPATVRNTQGQTTQVITPASPGVSRITTPDGRVQGYIHHSTGRITTPSGVTTGYASKR